jgi:predicted DCC family thiol-disulfide oxidoreductase YuxK
MQSVTVFYDADCGLCTRIKGWLLLQPKWIAMHLVPSSEAPRLYPSLAGLDEELIVISDEGGVYLDNHAWLICLFALKRYRGWAVRLSRPALAPLAREAFALLSSNRLRISQFLASLSDSALGAELKAAPAPRCHAARS